MKKTAIWLQYGSSWIFERGMSAQQWAGEGCMEHLPMSTPIYIITAWNPFEQRLSDTENRIRNDALQQHLHLYSRQLYDTYSIAPNGDWREDGFGITGISLEQGCAIAKKFQQRGIFVLTATEKMVFSAEDCTERFRGSRFE